VEALVTEARPEGLRLRIGAWVASLSAAGMSWASGWTAGRFQPGDVILVRVDQAPPGRPLEVSLDQDPVVEGALLAIEAASGYVQAMVGGYDFGRSQFNRAIQALRQPGSAFKPLVYAAALDHGYTPASIIIDAPVVFDDWSGPWKPENFDQTFRGPTRFREALVHSRNVVSVKIAEDIGLGAITSYLPRFGFTRPFPRNLSIALGSSEVTLLELVRAYGVFATGGKLYEPTIITSIRDRAGNVLERREPSFQPTISPETAYLITSMLQGVVQRGTGRRAAALHRPVAGKTGTTNEQMDAWFVGYTPDLVAGAWVGFDEKKTLGKKETGARAALPLWLEFMKEALKDRPVTDFPVPKDVVFVNIDGESGLRATPDDGDIVLECFKKGSEPQQFAAHATEPAPEDFFRGEF
jgi:penicillin-binding protein 1A